MASGLPAVATDHGGIPEVITHGKTGLLVPEHSPSELARALLRLADDPDFTATLARAGSDDVRATFSQERQIANIEALYREAFGEQ
jgi:glycosyltransferase involved in cell wall biosynthesis